MLTQAAKYNYRAIPLLLFALLFALYSSIPVFAKDDTVDVHTGYNIIFVVDNSQSLEHTDPARLRLSGLSKIL